MADNKSEKPTAQRMRKAREQGQFLVSRGFMNALQFVAALVLLGRLVNGLKGSLSYTLPDILNRVSTREITEAGWLALLRGTLIANLTPLLIFAGALVMVTLASHLAISKLGFSLERLTPKFGRLSPAGKLKELPAQNLKALIEAVMLMAALAAAVQSLIAQHGAAMLRMSLESRTAAAAQIGASITSLLWKAAALFIVFGAVDLMRQQRKYMGQLRMSKQEIKEESKRQEGDPQMKARIRRLRRNMLRKKMMQDVAQATAVVVNPTHFAVAIRYEIESMSSPLVVAKGKNWLALRIRQVAVENQVPIIENPPLARALYDAVEVGRSISPEFYKAIAEILAYVYRIMGRGLPR